MADNYTVVPARKAAKVRADQPATKIGLLRAGEMLFIPGKKYFGVWRSQLASEGYAFHQRKGAENGVEGMYIWADKPQKEK